MKRATVKEAKAMLDEELVRYHGLSCSEHTRRVDAFSKLPDTHDSQAQRAVQASELVDGGTK